MVLSRQHAKPCPSTSVHGSLRGVASAFRAGHGRGASCTGGEASCKACMAAGRAAARSRGNACSNAAFCCACNAPCNAVANCGEGAGGAAVRIAAQPAAQRGQSQGVLSCANLVALVRVAGVG